MSQEISISELLQKLSGRESSIVMELENVSIDLGGAKLNINGKIKLNLSLLKS